MSLKIHILLPAAALLLAACSEAPTSKPSEKPSTAPAEQRISTSMDYAPTSFSEHIANTPGALVLDVRTPEEFQAGHLAGAVNIDWYDAAFGELVTRYDKSTPVYVYCAVGGRSSEAKRKMQELGFQEVHNMLGGYNAWSAQGLPSEQ